MDFKKIRLKREFKKDKKQIEGELGGLVVNAIAKRIPDEKFGIMFSGGIDSTLIALVCKQLGVDFNCYTIAFEDKGFGKAEDLVWAEKVARELGFKLRIKKLRLGDIEGYARKVVNIIGEANVVKVGVGIVVQAAMETAKKDRITSLYSGLGSEEIFAGYERHRKAQDINKECVRGLRMIYERDMSRDNAIAAYNKVGLRLPFLDEGLVDYALRIPGEYKIKDGMTKAILRDVACNLGLPDEMAQRKKKAAQYGSKVDRAIEKLAKIKGLKKSEYLESFNARIGALFSSGKDSSYALYLMRKSGFNAVCLINVKSRNPDSYMYHTPNTEMVGLQAKAMGLPLVRAESRGEKEKELGDLRRVLRRAIEKYGVNGVVTGALYSEYQKSRVERICNELGLKAYSPLWHKSQEEHLKNLVRDNFEAIITAIAAEGLNEKWLGRRIDAKAIEELRELNKRNKLNIAGEGGEYESLVLNCPLFKRRIRILEAEKVMENKCTGRYIVKRAVLGYNRRPK